MHATPAQQLAKTALDQRRRKLWNDNPRPYVCTKTADQILDSIARYCTRINDSGH